MLIHADVRRRVPSHDGRELADGSNPICGLDGIETNVCQDDQVKPDVAVNAEFPNALNDYLYRVEKDGTVAAVNSLGEHIQFGNWKSFWEAAHS
jgi:hypothetical protein